MFRDILEMSMSNIENQFDARIKTFGSFYHPSGVKKSFEALFTVIEFQSICCEFSLVPQLRLGTQVREALLRPMNLITVERRPGGQATRLMNLSI